MRITAKFNLFTGEPSAKLRCGYLLALTESDRVHNTKVVYKFVDKLKVAFKQLNKNVTVRSFATHDMPLLVKLEEHEIGCAPTQLDPREDREGVGRRSQHRQSLAKTV